MYYFVLLFLGRLKTSKKVKETEIGTVKGNEKFDRAKVRNYKEAIELKKDCNFGKEEKEMCFFLLLPWRHKD